MSKSGIKKRGFASINKVKQRAIAISGGIAAHKMGKAHSWTSEEARAAGRKGGRGRTLISRQVQMVQEMRINKKMSLKEICHA